MIFLEKTYHLINRQKQDSTGHSILFIYTYIIVDLLNTLKYHNPRNNKFQSFIYIQSCECNEHKILLILIYIIISIP